MVGETVTSLMTAVIRRRDYARNSCGIARASARIFSGKGSLLFP